MNKKCGIYKGNEFIAIFKNYIEKWLLSKGEKGYLGNISMYNYDEIFIEDEKEPAIIIHIFTDGLPILLEINEQNFTYSVEIKNIRTYSFNNVGYRNLMIAGFAAKSIIDKTNFYEFIKKTYIDFSKKQCVFLKEILLKRKAKWIDITSDNPPPNRNLESYYNPNIGSVLHFYEPEFYIVKIVHSETTFDYRPGKDNVERGESITTYEMRPNRSITPNAKYKLLQSYLDTLKNTESGASHYWGPMGEDSTSIHETIDIDLTRTLLYTEAKDFFNIRIIDPPLDILIMESIIYFLFFDIDELISFIETTIPFSPELLDILSFFEMITRHIENRLLEEYSHNSIHIPTEFSEVSKFIKSKFYERITPDIYNELITVFMTANKPERYRRITDLDFSTSFFSYYKRYFHRR